MISARIRRNLIILMVLLAAAGLMSAAAATKGSPYSEAPMLHAKVVAGKLPPLAQRLPKEPFVEKVMEELGEYGGDWHWPWAGWASDKWTIGSYIEEAMFRFTPDGTAVIPNVAKSVKINDNYTEFTISCRWPCAGGKWGTASRG